MILRVFKRRQPSRRARLPEGVRIYAIGDIHGRADLLDDVLRRIDTHRSLNPTARPIHLCVGDYLDRGPNSREVVDILIARSLRHETIYLRGNHEVIAASFVQDPSSLREWSRLGGLETLMSYGLRPPLKADKKTQEEISLAFRAALPKAHIEFLMNLAPSFSCGGYYFAHAGIRPGIPLSQQKEEDLFWIRDDFLLCEDRFEKIVVHGHTPVRHIDIRPNRINIDTGAYATGRLSCIVLEKDSVQPL